MVGGEIYLYMRGSNDAWACGFSYGTPMAEKVSYIE
jgi:glutaredoxin-related protein